MLKITVHISDDTRREIFNHYGNSEYSTVESVVYDILDRYLAIDYFDSFNIENSEFDYEICSSCGEKSRHTRMIDVDGKNLVESTVCENCGSGFPERE